MANCGSAFLPGKHGDAAALVCLAGAYDWDSVETGWACHYSHGAAGLHAITSCCSTLPALTCLPVQHVLFDAGQVKPQTAESAQHASDC